MSNRYDKEGSMRTRSLLNKVIHTGQLPAEPVTSGIRELFDAVIISTLPARASRWLRLDLPHKVVGLGLPVTHVAAEAREVVAVAA